MAMSSNYNTRPRPSEVMVDGGRAVEDHPRFNLDEPTIARGMVTHPDANRVAMHVPEKAFFARVMNAHWSASA